jgi:hypothetical protein
VSDYFLGIHRYKKAWEILAAGDELTKKQLLSEAETDLIMGGTLQKLFPGAWDSAA